MTTIAYDGRYVACDSRMTIDDSHLTKTRKYVKLQGDGIVVVVFMAGDMGNALEVVDSLDLESLRFEEDKDCDCVFVVKKGKDVRVYLSCNTGYMVEVLDKVAIGSGYQAANAAMWLGYQAMGAVWVASNVDPFTGGEIYYVDTQDESLTVHLYTGEKT